MQSNIVNLAYLLAAVLFIFGLKGLTHPRTAVRGNLLGATGMLIAVLVTLFDKSIISYELIIVGVIVGGLIGSILAAKIQMTAMPQLVGLFNGFGGGASVLVAGAALFEVLHLGRPLPTQFTIASGASGLIGAVTFWGSLVAFGKLQGIITEKSVVFPGQKIINSFIAAVGVALIVWLVLSPTNEITYWLIVAVASILGVLLVIPIGGADMPVVIALLNSYSGLAAAATGFVLNNNVLIISGSLVGASGIILTNIMCIAMNRSLTNVLFGVMGPTSETATAEEVYEGKVKSTSAEEVAMLFDGARRVVVVPGYGMAVAQAQHTVRDMANLLRDRGIEVDYAIHPVAGRMPGHMNVLLAEANVPYENLKELDEINPTFEQTDVAIVLGANDVVNPVARTDPSSPIAGMPILDVDKARTVVVIKRSLSPGFAGIPNPLFAADNTLMFFNDGKKAIIEIIGAIKES
ncbi:MAG: NAD(P)(+) transhydrogenase (Re/Si-specific) subunit beta [candidate division Zixibacteria bacterium]|nr:NAD(P)(+) transhydrogenase (Re/Si-specific) subunit beta [candidate division Zixibacteria bacterium]NIT51621.1 NAD(P)(+) transhydrogenase (Re/Si-specific) subunit beta [candidate division Zixibacteria bacterium]NIU07985.1 NAD(P)(+) transhydrogenase (Re/Si-specific) subunit beta [Phycisphaerae bacterium]NIW39493.1 NAD synthetase [candidate division Zixibacteria bacterium]